MKKLPLAITTFEKIRDKSQNYLYIDKTGFAYQLIDRGEYYFLSRPRRFGKSLFIDTLSDLFQGKKELFRGLDIYTKWDWDTNYPVINISLNTGSFSTKEGIESRIFDIIDYTKEQYGVGCKKDWDVPSCFNELIANIYQKYQQKVVILIDEYDKPILDNITHKEQALVAREVLKTFYSVIKDNDKYIKFVFITGVSKFSKMNLFSGLNNLTDITIRPEYAAICGYTHYDIQSQFKEHLVGVDLEKLKQWYNGYDYLGKTESRVYNPYDILLFIDNHCEYENYWWGTGNASFLIKKLQEQNYYIPNLENIVVAKETLDSFDVDNIDLVALLWQTGYLTFAKKIIKRDKLFYQLTIPNKEIQSSLNELFIKFLTSQTVDAISYQDNIYDDITGNLEGFKHTLISLFAAIPYHNYANKIIEKYEGYYASVVFTYLMSLGYPCIAEDVTQKGRIDLTIKLPNRIVIIEFKVDLKEQALSQIKQKKYYQKYLAQAKAKQQDIYIVGICFASEDKNITEFKWECIQDN
jgi:hypothetical protein